MLSMRCSRLSGAAEAADAGLEEYLNGAGGVALVEWADRWIFPAAASGRVRRIHLAAAADNVREINYDGSGS